MRRSSLWVALICAACALNEEGFPQDASSSESSSSGGHSGTPPTITTEVTSLSSESTTSNGSSETGTDTGSESSSESDPDLSSSESGEIPSYALRFDGGLAISEPSTIVDFDGDPFTIEMWLRPVGPVEGVLFDTTVTVAGPNGLTLVRDENWTSTDDVVFYDFGVDPALSLFGADPNDLSPAWHHLAITHTGESVKLWVDGSMVGTVAAQMVADNAEAPIAIGTQPTTPFVPLTGIEIDELRISKQVRYDSPFVPEFPLGPTGAALHWNFDEGDGVAAYDSVEELPLVLSGDVSWSEAS